MQALMVTMYNSLLWCFIVSYFKEKIQVLVRLSYKDLQMANSKTRLCYVYACPMESMNFINPQTLSSTLTTFMC